ncbi:MAG: hypothetical protein A3C84_04685 [Candidatus Ryanbacteria bacterium RIFCSPHIGHO2_02_FULL_48_12]|uniref:Uncharacterized protein n=1 Tax=Candidatus Ryanbacteria bacterium RIFCSPHIGHO2_01_FULL_48_27 TaxID=1802115 RepID=A0A1G2G444_9BACT|nr:MAG: hypothetical protein A2756_04320 [Candidatus Ryanbacteria bacterium RIFCSPHIGHO2_01_FULL_48_27]OGZ48732.1 MAG: hypothetical protein A3C84_04685 [Candidatus Ryanbacteria bacterium RIFCSPHIGHO2_02_FULL_48_12]
MGIASIFFEYMSWHYGPGVHEFLQAWKNISAFVYQFFSVDMLLKTFFQPFKRMQEDYTRGFDPSGYAETFIVNAMMRVVGMVIRAVFIAGAACMQIVIGMVGFVFFIAFVGLPFAVPFCVIGGLLLLLL